MKTSLLYGCITLLLLWYNLYVSISIVNYLKSKGEEVSLFNGGFFIKGKIFRYLPVYREVTIRDTGKTALLYYQFYLSFSLIWVFLILGLLSL